MFVIAVAGLVVALATFAYARLTYRRQYPKRQLLLTMSTSRLVRQRVPDLEVLHRGRLLKAPQFIQVQIESTSRVDIASSAFDGGQPVELKFDREIILTDISENGIAAEVTEERMRIIPQLIKPGGRATIGAITEGRAQFDLRSSLIDIDVLVVDGFLRPTFVPTVLAIIASAMAAGVVSLIVVWWVTGSQ